MFYDNQVCDAISGAAVVGKRESSSRRQTGGQTTRVRCCTTPLCNRELIDTSSGSHSTGKYDNLLSVSKLSLKIDNS